MKEYLKNAGIIHETTAPYSPEQNGVAERANRTIMERVKAIIAEAKLDKRLWMNIVDTIVYLKNRSPTSAVATTPFELWHGAKPDISHLRIIGSTVYIHVPKEKWIKLDTHSNKGILLGYGGTNQYKVWDLTRKDVTVSRDVRFVEGTPTEGTMAEGTPTGGTMAEVAPMAPSLEPPRIMHDSITVLPGPPRQEALPPPEEVQAEETDTDEPEQIDLQVLLQGPSTEVPGRRVSSRTNKGILTSTRFGEEQFSEGRAHTAKVARQKDPNDEAEPATIHDAMKHPTRGDQWEKAIRAEYDSLMKNNTWVLVPRPQNRRVVTCKWALKHKRDAMNRIVRLKARLVARGFSQIYGIDYLDTYASVVKLASIRILLAIAAIYDLHIHQMDVVTAFLAGELEEEIYMEQPEGFEIGNPDSEDLVCKLLRSLYGLKQAPRIWNQRIRRFLKSIGFEQTHSDPCVYINKETGVIIVMWVNDLIIFGRDMKDINMLKAALKEEYEMKDIGELTYFLGIQVHRDREQKLIHIDQSGYIRMILERYEMEDCKSTRIPLATGTKLVKATTSDRLTDRHMYQSIVGSQMYAMLATRPDLAYSIQQISQHSQKPTSIHEKAARQGLRYLGGTSQEGITYDGKEGLKLKGWCDASWGAEEGRESVSGYVFTLAGGAVSWSSKKQSSVALSTTESEYMAILHALKEQIWIHRLLKEIGYDISDQNSIYTDSQSAIALAHNPEHHARTKHIDIQYHFIRNRVEEGTTCLEYCPTEDMVADDLTKSLGPDRHWKLIRMMGMKSSEEIGGIRSGSDAGTLSPRSPEPRLPKEC